VQQLDYIKQKNFPFVAILENGEIVHAKQTVLAIGFKYFKYLPSELTQLFPEGRYRVNASKIS